MSIVGDDLPAGSPLGEGPHVLALVGAAEAAATAATVAAAAVASSSGCSPAARPVLFRALDRGARQLEAAKLLLAADLAESSVWHDEGFTSAAGYLASVTGSSASAAHQAIAASKALRSLRATRDALVAGEISAVQAHVIADAAKHDPTAQSNLIATAKTASHKELRQAALRVKAAADRDPDATQERIHRERHCTDVPDAEGAWTLRAKATVAQGSLVHAELDVLTDQIFREQRSSDATEGRSQYRMDALARMAENSKAHRLGLQAGGKRKQAPPQHLALLRVDVSALQRGHVEGDETCEIAGVGPISVRQARTILPDAALRLIITNGVDVVNVTTLSHSPTQAMRYAMLWSNPCCVVEGCGNTILQFDHRTGVEFADTRHTKLGELDNECSYHHMLHTRHGWAMVEGQGTRPMVPPHDPRHPHFTPPPPDPVLVGDLSADDLADLAQIMRDALDDAHRNQARRDPTISARSP
jgi:hypothetical protein